MSAKLDGHVMFYVRSVFSLIGFFSPSLKKEGMSHESSSSQIPHQKQAKSSRGKHHNNKS
jgi:hypothetical protein